MIIKEANPLEGLDMVSITESAKHRVPFNPDKTISDSDGCKTRYIESALDEVYLKHPNEYVPEGMLPREEYEVRAALIEMKFFTERLLSFGFLVVFLTKDHMK